jgi:hypothetical protein
MSIKLRQDTLDGKLIGYHSKTEFYIQIGKGKKGSYRNRMTIVGNLGRAVFWYLSLNIGNGYKKRLVMAGSNSNRPLARASS